MALSHTVMSNHELLSLLDTALCSNNEEIVLLIVNQPNFNLGELEADDKTFKHYIDEYIMDVIQLGNTNFAKVLLEHPKMQHIPYINRFFNQAVKSERLDIVNILINHPDVKFDGELERILVSKKYPENREIIKILLLNYRQADERFMNSLKRLAKEENNLELINILDLIEIKDEDYYLLIGENVYIGNLDDMRRLLETPGINFIKVLMIVAYLGNVDSFIFFLERYGPFKGLMLSDALIHSIEGHNVDVSKYLLAKLLNYPSSTKVDIYNRALKTAVMSNFIDIVELLLEYSEFDPSVNNNAALKMAQKIGRKKISNILLQDERVIAKLQEE